MTIDLHLGDCLDVMRTIPDASIDTVITDPPYGISRESHFQTMRRHKVYRGHNFGAWDKSLDDKWISVVRRVLGQNSNLITFTSYENLGNVKHLLEEAGLTVRRPIILRKCNPPPFNRNRVFLNSSEFGLWATLGKWTFNRQGRYVESVFDTINNGVTSHPTEKHLPTMETIVRVLTNEGDTVLDPFMGSGTTGVACAKLNRNFIGIEINETYFAIAQQRIAEAQSQLALPMSV